MTMIKKIKLLALATLVFFGVSGVFAASTSIGPANLNSNVDGPITLGGTAQKKSGKFGLHGVPPPQYDFIVEAPSGNRSLGSTLFKGGVRTGSAFFGNDVEVGSVIPGSSVSVYGDVKVLGSGSVVINDALQHTSNTPQPVCSDVQGNLRLCNLAITN